MLEEIYGKCFTYEWLNKKDANNSILGLLCNCCATITSIGYGKKIAESSIIAPDVQNLVIRNLNGEIIAKGTMYINKEEGYGVINDFELNKKYRRCEKENSGRYYGEGKNDKIKPKYKKEMIKRKMIFRAFIRGIEEFAKVYDEKNPERPLKQINVGMGYNKFKNLVENYKKATSNLTVPSKYGFEDAEREQYILYKIYYLSFL